MRIWAEVLDVTRFRYNILFDSGFAIAVWVVKNEIIVIPGLCWLLNWKVVVLVTAQSSARSEINWVLHRSSHTLDWAFADPSVDLGASIGKPHLVLRPLVCWSCINRWCISGYFLRKVCLLNFCYLWLIFIVRQVVWVVDLARWVVTSHWRDSWVGLSDLCRRIVSSHGWSPWVWLGACLLDKLRRSLLREGYWFVQSLLLFLDDDRWLREDFHPCWWLLLLSLLRRASALLPRVGLRDLWPLLDSALLHRFSLRLELIELQVNLLLQLKVLGSTLLSHLSLLCLYDWLDWACRHWVIVGSSKLASFSCLWRQESFKIHVGRLARFHVFFLLLLLIHRHLFLNFHRFTSRSAITFR